MFRLVLEQAGAAAVTVLPHGTALEVVFELQAMVAELLPPNEFLLNIIVLLLVALATISWSGVERTWHSNSDLLHNSVSICQRFLLLATLFDQLESVTSSKPNVVLVLIDDFGYENVAFNGGESYSTPVLDQLSETGVRLEQLHVQPMCAPTRNALMTGITNKHNYVRWGYLDHSQLTFGNFFKNAGYETGIVGKWQLNFQTEEINAHVDHFGFQDSCMWQGTMCDSRYRNPCMMYSNGTDMYYSNDEYGPLIANGWALDFVTRKKDVPFFLYYPMLLTHTPFDPTPNSPDYLEPKPKKSNPFTDFGTKNFKYMVEYADMLIGRLVTKLDDLRLRDNTFLFILGDNGNHPGFPSQFQGREVLGGKTTSLIWGTHVPGIASWPGRLQPATLPDLIDGVDVLPTICEAANVPIPSDINIDGRSFFSRLQGAEGSPRESLYIWYSKAGGHIADFEFAQTDHFKLYRTGMFYDLFTDDREERPLGIEGLPKDARAAYNKLSKTLSENEDSRLTYFVTGQQGRDRQVGLPPSQSETKQLMVWEENRLTVALKDARPGLLKKCASPWFPKSSALQLTPAFVEACKYQDQDENFLKRTGLMFVQVPKAASTTGVGATLRIARGLGLDDPRSCAAFQPGEAWKGEYGKRNRTQSFLWTVVREPSSRALSQLLHFGYRAHVDKKLPGPFKDAVVQRLASKSNLQLDYLQFQKPERHDAGLQVEYYKARVKKTLRQYDFVAVAERMDESMVVLQMLLGLPVGGTMASSSVRRITDVKCAPGDGIPTKIQLEVTEIAENYFESQKWHDANFGDFLLHSAASLSLDQTIENLGRELFEKKLEGYRKIKAKVSNECITEYNCAKQPKARHWDWNRANCLWRDAGCGFACVDGILEIPSAPSQFLPPIKNQKVRNKWTKKEYMNDFASKGKK